MGAFVFGGDQKVYLVKLTEPSKEVGIALVLKAKEREYLEIECGGMIFIGGWLLLFPLLLLILGEFCVFHDDQVVNTFRVSVLYVPSR